MSTTRTNVMLGALALLALLAQGCGGPKGQPAPAPEAAPAPAPPKSAMQPEAAALLRRMSDTLAAAKAIRLATSESHERVRHDGTKVTRTFEREMVVERPNHAWLSAKGENTSVEAWYDGKTFALRQADEKMYAKAVVPPTLDEFLDYMAARVPLRMPMADLFYASAYDSYVGPDTAGRVVGIEDVEGVAATHLAFTDPSVDFDIWISEGDAPLPVKLVLTYKRSRGAPTSSIAFESWDLQPKLDPAMFAFHPGPDDTRIRFVGQTRPAPDQG